MHPPADDRQKVLIGRISGLLGVRGWVRLWSWTRPRENLFEYAPWLICMDDGWREFRVLEWRPHGKGLVARLQGIEDRDQAARLLQRDIMVPREQLPALEEGWYWVDLVGLEVVTAEGEILGRVTSLMETGANDVLVVAGERQRLIPFTPGHAVREVDMQAGRIVVDWDPDF